MLILSLVTLLNIMFYKDNLQGLLIYFDSPHIMSVYFCDFKLQTCIISKKYIYIIYIHYTFIYSDLVPAILLIYQSCSCLTVLFILSITEYMIIVKKKQNSIKI